MPIKAGKFGKVIVGSGSGQVELAVTSWKIKHVSDDLDVTSTESEGFREYQDGLEHLEVTLEANWNAAMHPGIAPLDMQNTKYLNSVELFADRNLTNPDYTIPKLKISDSDSDLGVDGIVKYTINGKSSASFTVGTNTN